MLTEKAVSAERLHVDGYTVAGLDGFDCRTDLLDHADHLMADRNTGDGTRHRAVLDVQIARADARHGNAHHRVSCMRENGFRLVLQGKLTLFSLNVISIIREGEKKVKLCRFYKVPRVGKNCARKKNSTGRKIAGSRLPTRSLLLKMRFKLMAKISTEPTHDI